MSKSTAFFVGTFLAMAGGALIHIAPVAGVLIGCAAGYLLLDGMKSDG